ncbi:MAG: hypothetical protein J6I55_04245 [Ruminococcus sp.]|nr:hypothetical protein [Ruminococcus sp.]
MSDNNYELTRDEYTEYIYNEICFGEPANVQTPEDVTEGISRAIELDARPVFLEGLSARLTQLGIECSPDDTEIMLSEVKKRYKSVLGKTCPRTVKEWCRGTTPGITNFQNHYDLCFALEMDYKQTAVFFQKHYLAMPFNIKNSTDAVFLYCMYHKKPYFSVNELLEKSKKFMFQEKAHTSTSQIANMIFNIDDDEKFLQYLSEHCYSNEQQFQLARSIIRKEIEIVRKRLVKYEYERILSPERLGSLTIEALLGIKYQGSDKKIRNSKLPKRFTKSLPNDVTLGKIINGDVALYDLLRKTLMLLKFYNFYYEADNCDKYTIGGNLMDFYEETDNVLASCGFAQIYLCHPFDCLLMYCANSYDPIDTLYCVMQNG